MEGVVIDMERSQMRKNGDGGDGGGSGLSVSNETDKPITNVTDTIFDRAPERKLTVFALWVAVLEKTASGLGTLGFIWATVVLLGGFAITIDKVDFWVVTVILLIESARIFSRSHELEWQHQATWSVVDAGRYSFRALKSGLRSFKLTFKRDSHLKTREIAINNDRPDAWISSSEVPLLPYTGWVFLSRNISRVLYWLQLLSASTCVALSLTRLIQQDYGEIQKGDSDKRNRKSALNIFYSLALAEALLFLMEKAYWEWKVTYCKLLEEVNADCGFDDSGVVSIKRFFYDAYSRCINGSIFDGLKMDLVSFGEELILESNSRHEQLIGVRILNRYFFTDHTLETNNNTIERLVEMLNWKNARERELRMTAAEILLKLAGKKHNSLRVASIPGSMQSISSLLCSTPLHGCRTNLLGLRILKKLAHDHDNCAKMGNTRGLLQKVIDFTTNAGRILQLDDKNDDTIESMKMSLQVLKMLVSTTGATGRMLRQEIAEIVFTISNIRDILQFGEGEVVLHKLAIEILTNLAMDEESREKIGRTGGIISTLFGLFFKRELVVENKNTVRVAAGEALMMLSMDSVANCKRMMKMKIVERLIGVLEDRVLRIYSASILLNLCLYSEKENSHCLKEVTIAMPTVLKALMNEEKKPLEVSLGLATQILNLVSPKEAMNHFKEAKVEPSEFSKFLVGILRRYNKPCIDYPRMRRFVIELSILLMRFDEKNVAYFREENMANELEIVTTTTSELEFFNLFSGGVGLCRHSTSIQSLVSTALEMMDQKN